VGKLQERPDPESLFAEAQERMQALQPPQVDRRFVYGWDTVGGHQVQIAQRVKDAEEGKASPFLWPWPSWNAVVRPLRAGMLGLVAGADGTGKSTYLECIAEHWAKGGMHVVYVHLEDDLEYKLDRRLARWARVPMQAIEDGALTAEQTEKIGNAQGDIDVKLPTLHYYAAPGLSMTEIVRELETRVDKTPTAEITKNLLLQGKSLQDVASERNLTLGTIITHLESIKKLNSDFDFTKLNIIDKSLNKTKVNKIKKALKNNKNMLTPTLSELEKSGLKTNYEEIRLARLL
jgi:replicative DNA helicase